MLNKQKAEAIVKKFKNAGVTKYSVTSTSANIRFHNGDTSKIIFDEDGAWNITYSNDYIENGAYDLYFMPYDMIETINTVAVDFEAGLKLIDSLSLNVDDEFIKSTVIRRDIHIKKDGSVSNIAAMKDENGNYVLPKGSSGYVV